MKKVKIEIGSSLEKSLYQRRKLYSDLRKILISESRVEELKELAIDALEKNLQKIQAQLINGHFPIWEEKVSKYDVREIYLKWLDEKWQRLEGKQ